MARLEENIRLDDRILEHRLQPPDFELYSISESRIVLRKFFPETWLWMNSTAGSNGQAVIRSAIPDTITSWFISAFAMDQINGLGIAPNMAKVTVFRPFFIKLSLSYSIIRGESVAIQAIVFNYMNKSVVADVVMDNKKGEFEFTNTANEIVLSNSITAEQRKTITVPGNDGVSVTFVITPLKIGYIDIRLSASSSVVGDAVSQKLLVKPEGQPQYFNKAILINLNDPSKTEPIKNNISITLPQKYVQGSEKVYISGIGDILGPTLNNLEDLLRMPYGCGEQNMINFVPNIVILDYLTRANRLSPQINHKARRNIESGYQRELTYKRDDGSFSAFGQSDKSGSTWLTAFVLKSFIQAREYLDVDQGVIDKSVEFLFSRQNTDGSFSELGEIHSKELQGGSGSGGSAALTAYVLIALLQDKKIKTTRKNEISSAENYLWKEFQSTKKSYTLGMITYALHLSESRLRDTAFGRLMNLAKKSGDYIWWTDKTEETNHTDKQSAHFFYPRSNDIEMTSYALLTLIARSDIDSALPVLRWLISQQNSNGGYSSTQDTVIGIQALGALAQRISTTTVSISAKFNYKSDEHNRNKLMNIDQNNALILQRMELPSNVKWVEVEASGFGTAVLQVSWQYNLQVAAENPAFFLNPQNDKTSTENYLQLSVCTYYKDGNSTNMAVMDVELPSGYVADVDALPSVTRAKEVKRIDTTNGDTNVLVYFDRITRNELCITVPAHRTFKVANHKPVPVTVYDYYDRSKQHRIFYEPQQVKTCDIVDGNECSDRGAYSNQQKDISNICTPSWLLLISFTFAMVYEIIVN